MLKIVSFFNFRPDVPTEESRRYWLSNHEQVVKEALPECRKYVQNPPVLMSRREWMWDGISELWFDDMDSIRRSFEGPLADKLRADEDRFVDRENVHWMIVEEKDVF